MVSIIKNQLLKHLSRFTKNLSADKINLSTFKGEGELTNLELDEIVLTDLLELPSWLRLTKAWCNKVAFRIPWTKLKSVPIHLSLDEVNVTVETCEELRSMSAQGGLSSYTAPGKYSFIHKVIDGITVTVNVVNVLFNSPAFTATVQISRIVVESTSPKFTKSDLRMTRLKNPDKGQLLIFKELKWQTVRIEAKSTIDKNLTPLRLLTNQARCRIVIKKRLSDCFILGSRLVIILDDLLWVLTDSQLKAALHFLDSLSGLIQKATRITRKAKAARKLEELPEYQAQLAQEARGTETKPFSRTFSLYDVVETSYHFLSNQIVLHLCDDPGAGRSSHPNLKDGGALQICVKSFQVDFYPYHLAKSDRKHWPIYDSSVPHAMWQEQALQSFKSKFMDLVDKSKVQHTPLTRSPKSPPESLSSHTAAQNSSDIRKTSSPQQKEIKKRIERQFAQLMTTCVIIRIDDFTLYRVTTSGKKQALKEFVCGDRYTMSLPKEASIVHAEFIYYYYPSDLPFPLPPPKFYVHLNPIQIVFDVDTCLWLNSFGLNLYQSLLHSKNEVQASSYTYIDVKIEAILPKISFESTVDHHAQKDRPKCLGLQVTRVTLTNIRSLEQSSRADLAKCVDSFHMGSLFFGSEFPSAPSDFYIVTQKFLDHISASDNIRDVPKEFDVSSLEALVQQLCRELLWTEAKDVWCISLDPVFGDFHGARGAGINKPVPFLDAVPITLWVHSNLDPNSTIKANCDQSSTSSVYADIHVLAHISNLVSLQINHYQYLFLLRLAEEAAELATFLNIDSDRILKVQSNSSLVVGALIPQLELTFVMPPQCPGKESSGGDVESFVPDFSSVDDVGIGAWNSSRSILQLENSLKPQPYPLKIVNGGSDTHNFEMLGVPESEEMLQYFRPHQPPSGNASLQNNFNVGLSSMKKGFTNLMSSLDSALKPSPDDISDTISIRSDISSDSDKLILGAYEEDMLGADLMFYVAGFQDIGRVEEASEVIEEDPSITSSDQSLTSSCRRKDLVSVATFRLNKVEFLQQSLGYSSSIKLQVASLSTDECSSIPWDEFQSKFSTRSRAWTDDPSNLSTTSKVRCRLDHTLILPSSKSIQEMDLSSRENLQKIFTDMLTVDVRDFSLDLNMSTVTGLADLAEDEIIPVPLPMKITVENMRLHLIEDRPPVNITSPGPVPIDLNIMQLFITRGADGVFNLTSVQPDIKSSTSSIVTAHENEDAKTIKLTKQLSSDNEELKRRLLAFERVSEENRSLRKAKEETDILRSCLIASQDEVSRLLEEKKNLLDDMKRLQSQISNSGWQWNNSKR